MDRARLLHPQGRRLYGDRAAQGAHDKRGSRPRRAASCQMAEGGRRVPGIEWIYDFHTFKVRFEAENDLTLHASCHMYGRWVCDLLLGGDQFIQDRGGWLDRFQRMQINTHASTLDKDHEKFAAAIKKIADHKGHITNQFIIQQDGVNDSLLEACCHAGVDAVPLFDMSHGEGVCPGDWPVPLMSFGDPPMYYCGYAGGLGPDSLEEELVRIADAVDFVKPEQRRPIWIDMETHIRSNNDAQFDLDKVRACLEIAQPYVCERSNV